MCFGKNVINRHSHSLIVSGAHTLEIENLYPHSIVLCIIKLVKLVFFALDCHVLLHFCLVHLKNIH